jgi:hypothetical protein
MVSFLQQISSLVFDLIGSHPKVSQVYLKSFATMLLKMIPQIDQDIVSITSVGYN